MTGVDILVLDRAIFHIFFNFAEAVFDETRLYSEAIS